MRRTTFVVLFALSSLFTATAGTGGSMIPEIPSGFEKTDSTRTSIAPTPRGDLPGTSARDSAAAAKGVAWLVKAQQKDGGWAAGGWGGSDTRSDVATTAYVIQALRRSGRASSDVVNAGVEYVIRAVENAPEGPMLDTPQGTQPQGKLGSTVDTYYAASLMGELLESGSLPSHLRARADRAHDVLIGKIQAAQTETGSFSRDGWAPVLATSVAMDALNDAARMGKAVDKDVLKKADEYNAGLVAGPGVDTSAAAGVPLYAVAGALAANDEAVARAEREGQGRSAPAAEARKAAASTRAQVAASPDQLIQGFGSAGGEEMLSYQMVSDTLAREGGKEWDAWSGKIGEYLRTTQNADGSWAGHHCITSAVFVTAGAVMTLSAGGSTPRG